MREDLLASICVIDEGDIVDGLGRIGHLIDDLAKNFRYFEVVYVVSELHRTTFSGMGATLSQLRNLRVVLTAEGTGFYRQRALAVSEAIGDVVALIDLNDLTPAELCEQVLLSKDRNEVRIGWQSRRSLSAILYPLLSVLSSNSISSAASRTIIMPREKMAMLLSRGSASLDLRFEPKTPLVRYQRFPIVRAGRRRSPLDHQYELMTEILVTGAPRYLKIYALMAFLVAFVSVLYAAYAILVYSLDDDVVAGWFSTSIVQSGSTFFVATGMSMLSLAIAAILENGNGKDSQFVAGEFANIDFFEGTRERNVEFRASEETGQEEGVPSGA